MPRPAGRDAPEHNSPDSGADQSANNPTSKLNDFWNCHGFNSHGGKRPNPHGAGGTKNNRFH